MRGLPVRAEDRRYLNIPVSRVTYCRVRGPPEPSGATRLRGFDRRPSVCISGASPEVRPKAAFERPEVFKLHYPLATLAHELQLAVEVQNLMHRRIRLRTPRNTSSLSARPAPAARNSAFSVSTVETVGFQHRELVQFP